MPHAPAFASRGVRLLLTLLSMLILAGLVYHYGTVGTNAISRQASSDFYKFYLSAQRVRAGESMYWLVPPRERQGDACHPDTPDTDRALAMPSPDRLTLGGELPCLGPNLNPPIFMAVMLPLSLLPYGQAWWIWAAFSSICTVFSVWLLTGSKLQTTTERMLWTLFGSTALFACYPTVANFSLGQLGSALLPLLTMSWLDLRHDKPIRSGLWLGVAIGVKPFLGVLLIGLLVLGNWKALVSATCALLGLCVVGVMMFGVSAYQDYALVASHVSWTATNWNGSWFGFFDRYFSGMADANWPANKPLSKALGTAFALLTVGLWAWITHGQQRRAATRGVDALFAAGLPVALLASPLGWAYYFPALALSGFIAWQHANIAAKPRPLRLALLLSGVMSVAPISLKPSPSPLNPALWFGIDAWYFYVLVGALCTFVLPLTAARQEA